MSWVPVILHRDAQLPEIKLAMEKHLVDIEPFFTDAEKAYQRDWVKNVVLIPFPAKKSGSSGGYMQKFKAVFINSTYRADPESEVPLHNIFDRIKFDIAHELTHPIFALAAQDSPLGILIVSADTRAQAQQKAQDLFPKAIAAAEAYLQNPNPRAIQPADYTPQEQVAMLTFMFLDDRFYKLFGNEYDKAKSQHEIACNLRAMQACEGDVLGITKPSIVDAIAGDVIATLNEKAARALLRPNREPFRKNLPGNFGGWGPAGAGS